MLHILGDCRLADKDAELLQLSLYVRGTPERILPRQSSDERSLFEGQRRPATTATLALPSPVLAEAGTMPADHRVRFDDEQWVTPIRPIFPEQNPKEPISILELRTLPTAVENLELMTES